MSWWACELWTAAWMRGCMAAWLRGCVAAWLRGCVAAWLRGCVAAWLRGCVAAWLRGCGCVAAFVRINQNTANDVVLYIIVIN